MMSNVSPISEDSLNKKLLQDSKSLSFADLRDYLGQMLNSKSSEFTKEIILCEKYVACYSDKLEVLFDKLLADNFHNSLQREKKEIFERLLSSAKQAFANFLYYLTTQKKAKMVVSEIDSFLQQFLVTGTDIYHFYIDGKEYFVEFKVFTPHYSLDIQESNPQLKKFKEAARGISKKIAELEQALLNVDVDAAQKILKMIAEIAANSFELGKSSISAKDLETIQKLQAELAVPETIVEDEKQRVSPVTVRNNPRVPNQSSAKVEDQSISMLSHKDVGTDTSAENISFMEHLKKHLS